MSFPYQDQLRSLQRAYLLGPACLLPCPWELKLFYFKPMSNFYITRLASLEAYLLGTAHSTSQVGVPCWLQFLVQSIGVGDFLHFTYFIIPFTFFNYLLYMLNILVLSTICWFEPLLKLVLIIWMHLSQFSILTPLFVEFSHQGWIQRF